MGGFISSLPGIGGAVGAVSDLVTGDSGGKNENVSSTSSKKSSQTQEQTNTIGAETPTDALLREGYLKEAGGLSKDLSGSYSSAAANSNQINDLFRNALVSFVSGGGRPTPENIADATSFVDQTFTAPAQKQFQDYVDTLSTNTSARAAALGRNSLDSSINNQFVSAGTNAAKDLANERGSRIASRADELSYARPMEGLQSLLQASNYFNTPLQQAIANRLNLLNSTTAQQGLGLNARIRQGTTKVVQNGSEDATSNTAGRTTEPVSFGTNLTNAGNALGQGISSLADLRAPTPQLTPNSSGNYQLGTPNYKFDY
jgi:hypothetical protein